MSKVFEDAFMEVITDMVSLSVEVLERINAGADIIFVYAYSDRVCTTVNAFCEKAGQIKYLSQVGCSWSLFDKYTDIAMDDLRRLKSVCADYNRPAPTQIKMVYNINSGSLDTDYRYENICNERDVSASDLFDEWVNEEKKKREKV